MKVLTKADILQNKEFYRNKIKKGEIFVYPTDTIYGIGCIPTNDNSVEKIRLIKQRDSKPFSIIVPSKEWIKKNCKIPDPRILNKLPGKYTLIFKLKDKEAISKKITSSEELGVRIPNHWFAKFLSESNLKFITTSANISGKPPIKSISDLEDSIKKQVDYIIEDGILDNSPSTIIDLTKNGRIVKRD